MKYEQMKTEKEHIVRSQYYGNTLKNTNYKPNPVMYEVSRLNEFYGTIIKEE